MEYAEFSDFRVIAASWIGAVSTLLTLLLLLAVVQMRLSLMAREWRSRAFRERAQNWLIRLIAGETFELPKIARRDLADFLYQWVHFQEILRGDSKLKLNQALRCSRLDERIRMLLLVGSFEERLIAATVLGHLRDVQAWEPLLVLLKKPSPLLSMTSLRALVSIDPDRASRIAIPLIVHQSDWAPIRLAILLRQADPIFHQAFLSYLEANTLEAQPATLLMLNAIPGNRPLPIVEKLLVCAEPQLQALSLRLVCHPYELDLVRNSCGDDDWLVQLQIIGVLGRMGEPQDVRYFLSLLDSEHWWVRYRAAQALFDSPFIKRHTVKRLIENRTDRFARDMLVHILAEKVKR